MPDTPAPQPAPGPNTTEISPAEGDSLVQAVRTARHGVRSPGDTPDLSAGQGDPVDEAAELPTPRPPPLGT